MKLKFGSLAVGVLLGIGIPAIPFGCLVFSSSRGMAPDDPLRLEQFGEAAIDPSGTSVAYVRIRSKTSRTMHMRNDMAGDDRSDIWIGAVEGGSPRNITAGEKDGAGYWAPVWSPDGQSLAMMSTKDGNVRLWIWNGLSDRLQLTTERAVGYRAGQRGLSKPVWLSSTKLLYARLPEGERPVGDTYQVQSPEVAISQCPRACTAVEPTPSLLTTGHYKAASYDT